MRYTICFSLMAIFAAGMFGCGSYPLENDDEPGFTNWIEIQGISLCLNLDDVDLDPCEDIYSYGHGHGGANDWQESDSRVYIEGDYGCYDYDWNGEGLWRINFAYEEPDSDSDWADVAYWCSNPETRHEFCFEDSDGAWSLGFETDGEELSEADEEDLEDTE
jgi:hypothetical protein